MNEDIIRHIYSFGYPEHRIYMKQLCKQLNRVLIENIYPVVGRKIVLVVKPYVRFYNVKKVTRN